MPTKSKKTTSSKPTKQQSTTAEFNAAFGENADFMKLCNDYNTLTMEAAKTFSVELFQFANKSLADNMEISKEFLNCRTIDDAVMLQDRILRSNMDNFFNQTARMSEMALQYSSEASEPLNDSLVKTSKKLNKTFSG